LWFLARYGEDLSSQTLISVSETDIIRPFQSDEDLVSALELSTAPDSHTLRLYIDAPRPTSADPLQSPSYAMVSFYTFQTISQPEALVEILKQLWKPFNCYGRVYVAEEGVNAQMAVPSNVLSDFQRHCQQFPLLADVRINVDRHLSATEFFKTRPFKALHVRHRRQIVTDGFAQSLDWKDAGTELSSREWDQQLSRAVDGEGPPRPLLFDCRNVYESEIGLFEGAVPLNTVRFSDSWDVLEKALEGKPKDTPIMTYCTGGIRSRLLTSLPSLDPPAGV
jgi:predicted sulfurtransferase